MTEDLQCRIAESKYRYLRSVDTRDFELMHASLTEDAVGNFNNGAYVASGRAAIVELNRKHLTDDYVSTHTALHPEVTRVQDDVAEVTWQLLTHVLRPSAHTETTSRGIYHDEYRLEDGVWRISHTTSQVRSSTVQTLDPAFMSVHL